MCFFPPLLSWHVHISRINRAVERATGFHTHPGGSTKLSAYTKTSCIGDSETPPSRIVRCSDLDPNMMKQLLFTFLAIISTANFQAAEIVAVAHPGENLTYDRIVVWTPLFQAAWDDLHRGFGAPVKIDPPNALMDRLDHFTWKADVVMPRDHWKVWAGNATQELIDKANAEAARMTGEKKGPFQIEPRPDARIALALLDRDLVFKKPLHRSVDAPLVFHSADGTKPQVRFFGTRRKASDGYDGVVRVLAYQAGSHALQIASDADDSAVLYLPEFFVFLWRDGAEWPYFGAWIGNGTPMEEFKET